MATLAAVLIAGGTGALGAALFQRRAAAAAVAALVATMPLMVVHQQHSWNNLLAVTGLLGWLGATGAFERTHHWKWLALAGGALGVTTAAGGNGVVTAPLLLAVTVIALVMINQGAPVRSTRAVLPVAAFLVVIGPLLIYLAINPQWYLDRVHGYGLYDASRFNVLQGMREITSWVGLTARSEVYWHYFDPSFLYFSGRTLVDALTKPGMFLLPFAVLLPVGAFAVFTLLPSRVATALVAWFFMSPAAAALVAQPPVASRLILIVPAAAMLAYAGFVQLHSGGRGSRALASVLAVSCVLNAATVGFHLLR